MATPWSSRRTETIPGPPERIAPPDTTPTQTSSGWVAVEAHLQKHDDVMVRDSDEDINALLVFAGLFSAILTAFIIESYQWLQEDYSQTSANLLSYIAANQSGSSNTSNYPLSEFKVQISDVWVNILWFLSLVFSLASAFLGILAKQWIREYRQWHSPLATSRENVRLRQLRYEAWTEWKVPQSIGILPALLEIALVLFLSGLLILLWTLHHTVAAIVSSVVAAFLLTAFTVTIWPVWQRRCPYKSPIGWVLVRLWTIWNRRALSLFRLLGFKNKSWWIRWAAQHESVTTWRQRELQAIPKGEKTLSSNSSASVDSLNDLEKTQVQADSAELLTLINALSWVSRDSQDLLLLKHINQCISSFHRTSDYHIRFLIDLRAARNWFLIGEESLAMELHSTNMSPSDIETLGFGSSQLYEGLKTNKKAFLDPDAPFIPTRLHRTSEMNAFYSWKDIGVFRAVFMPVSLREGVEHSAVQLLIDLMLRDVDAFVTYMLLHPIAPDGHPAKKKEVRRFMSLICFLLNAFRYAPDKPLRGLEEFAGILMHAYDKLSADPIYESLYPGFRTVLLELLIQLGRVEILSSRNVHVHLYQQMTLEDYIRMSLQLYDSNTGYQRKDDCHMFVTIADYAFQRLGDYAMIEEHSNVVILIKRLVNVCTEALRTCTQRGWSNCGSYTGLPWISTLASVIRFRRDLATYITQTFFDNLAISLNRYLITVLGARSDFVSLTEMTPHYSHGPESSSVRNTIPTYSNSSVEPSGTTQITLPQYQSAGSMAPPYSELYTQASTSGWVSAEEEKQRLMRGNTYIPFTYTQTSEVPVEGPGHLPQGSYAHHLDDSPPSSPTLELLPENKRLHFKPTVYHPAATYTHLPQHDQSTTSSDNKLRVKFDDAQAAMSRFLRGDTQILPFPPSFATPTSNNTFGSNMLSSISTVPSYHTSGSHGPFLPYYSSPAVSVIKSGRGHLDYIPMGSPPPFTSHPGTRNQTSDNPQDAPSTYPITVVEEKTLLERTNKVQNVQVRLDNEINQDSKQEAIVRPPTSYESASDATLLFNDETSIAPAPQPFPPASTPHRSPTPPVLRPRSPPSPASAYHSLVPSRNPSQADHHIHSLPPPITIERPTRPEEMSSSDTKVKQRDSSDNFTVLQPDKDRSSKLSSIPYTDSVISQDKFVPQQQRVRFRKSNSSIDPSETDTSAPAASPRSIRFSGLFGSLDHPLNLSVNTKTSYTNVENQVKKEPEYTSAEQTPRSAGAGQPIRALPATPNLATAHRPTSSGSLSGRPLRRLPSLPTSPPEHDGDIDFLKRNTFPPPASHRV